MNNKVKGILIICVGIISQPLIGFGIGKLVAFLHGEIGNYNAYFNDYSLEIIFNFPIIFVTLTLMFIPYFIIGWAFIKNSSDKLKSSFFKLLAFMILIYILYGLLFYRGDFWHIWLIPRRSFTFTLWLRSEHKDIHFSVSSLLSAILFTYLAYRANRPKPSLMENNDISA